MIYSRITAVLAIGVLAAVSLAQTASTGGVYAVGTCKPSLPSYATISAALAATPAPTTVQVCPGNYPEQVVITQGVTLQGITSGGGGQAVLSYPSTGYGASGTGLQGWNIYPQLWVNNATGPVTINDITIDVNQNSLLFAVGVGIFFQNSSGSLNRVTVRNVVWVAQDIGFYLEGGASNPTVTVQNSTVHNIGSWGIYAESLAIGTSLTAVVKSNYASANNAAIFLDGGSSSTVTNNTINGSDQGILTSTGAEGSVSSNTTVASGIGIVAGADGVSVTGNKILGSLSTGISVTTAAAPIQSNTIVSTPVGIDFGCINNASVNSNILSEIANGLNNVPGGVTTTNSYFNVGTIRSAGTCAGSH